MSVLLPAATEGDFDRMSVILPPFGEIFWGALVLLAILLVVGKYALPRIYAMLDEREAKIQEGLGAAEKAKEDRSLAAREREELLREANVEAQGTRERAAEDARRILAEAREEARAESQRILEAGQRQIEAERQAAEISLRSDVGLLAAELAERIVGEQLKDTALSARVVDRFLDELERDTTSVPGGVEH
ncbi:MAG: F0F1 ATP synthase subunit B [Propionibacterium sp.]|nr:F0F1 ATP synthase subunit B [Propionibacterium sp.]